MKRLRAAQSLSEAIAIRSFIPRQSRLLSTTTFSHKLTPHYSSPRLSLSTRQPLCRTNLGIRYGSTAPASTELQKTPLYDLHVANGGKMVPFGGFHMPVQYSSLSVSASHHFTRSHASLFDVSHMVQHHFSGPGAEKFLERITAAGIVELPTFQGGLGTLLWPETGGIVDDTIITRLGPELFYVVTNAGCREKDLSYLEKELEAFEKEIPESVNWQVLNGQGLVALQGPLSEQILASVLSDEAGPANLKDLYFGQSRFVKIKLLDGKISSTLLISRGGYTGEDGFEISIPEAETVAVTETLLNTAGQEKLQLAGLGARDSLRLEAGMCLYGHDLDDNTTPIEASLGWTIAKSRKTERPNFHGAAKILSQATPKSKGGTGVERRRVGFLVEGAPAREGVEIVNENGEKIGNITSGCPSPTLGKNVAMGYIKDGFHKAGTEVEVVVRGKKRKATVTKMPFVPSKYWKER